MAHPETHGASRTSLYKVWQSMRERCGNPRHRRYKFYGGRGITVCEAWHSSFTAFAADMGPPPTGARYTLERIDNDKGYYPANCRWATYREQNRNNVRNVYVEIDGKRMTLIEAAEGGVVSYNAFQKRLSRGWDPVRARTTPSLRGQK